MEKVKKVVRHLRNKPEEERRHILNISMFIMVCFIFVIWLFTLGVGKPHTVEVEKIKPKKGLEPFSVLKSNLIDGYQSINEGDAFIAE